MCQIYVEGNKSDYSIFNDSTRGMIIDKQNHTKFEASIYVIVLYLHDDIIMLY